MLNDEYGSGRIADALRDTMATLLEARRETGAFTDDDESAGAGGKTGTMASMQGLRTVLGALVALRDEETWRRAESHLGSLVEEWRTVVRDQERSRACKPYNPAVGEVLGVAETSYTDAVAWVLSTAVTINYLREHLKSHGYDAALAAETRQCIVESLRELLASQSADGGWTWGHVTGAPGHLYFTWSALQGYADYYDYISGESATEIGIGPDEETLAYLAENELSKKRIDDSRERAATFLEPLAQTAAEGALKVEELDQLHGKIAIRLRPQLEHQSQRLGPNLVPALYVLAYLQESLILADFDSDKKRREVVEKLQEVLRRRFVEGSAWLDAAPAELNRTQVGEVGTLLLSIERKSGYMQQTFIVRDVSLWPQVLRTFVLYEYYVAKGTKADEVIIGKNSAYEALIADRIPKGARKNLWDQGAFNLAITARAVEGLIDVHDYLDRLERIGGEASPEIGGAAALVALLAENVYPAIESRLRKSLEEASPASSSGAVVDARPAVFTKNQMINELRSQCLNVRQLAETVLGETPRGGVIKKNVELSRLFDQVVGTESKGQPSEAFLKAIVAGTVMTLVKLLPEIIQAAAVAWADDDTDMPDPRELREAAERRLGKLAESLMSGTRV